jgi:hypothetical protein
LKTGIFKTSGHSELGYGKVSISFDNGFYSGSLEPGTDVYVVKLGEDSFEITICDAPWKYSSTTTFHFKTHFITPTL